MEKEHIKKLLYSFLKGKEYLNKTVISQNLSIIDEVIESSEQNKSVKLVGIKNTSDIDRNIIKKLVNNNKSNTLPTNFHFSDWFTGFINSIAKLFKGS